MMTYIVLGVVALAIIFGGVEYLKDDRPFDYSEIADIIEADEYLESIKKKK